MKELFRLKRIKGFTSTRNWKLKSFMSLCLDLLVIKLKMYFVHFVKMASMFICGSRHFISHFFHFVFIESIAQKKREWRGLFFKIYKHEFIWVLYIVYNLDKRTKPTFKLLFINRLLETMHKSLFFLNFAVLLFK